MANVPQINTTGITQSEGMLGQLFNYISSLNGGATPAPQVSMAGLPTQKGVNQSKAGMMNAPMTSAPGGGIDPFKTQTYNSALELGSNPAHAAVAQERQQAQLGIEGQNLQLQGNNLFNNMSLQSMISSLLAGTAGSLGQLGTYAPNLRGQSQQVAASGTGSGGGGLMGMFGL